MSKLTDELAPDYTALLVVDVQNDFCHREGVCARAGRDMILVEQMMPNLLEFISEARKAGVTVVFVRTLISEWTDSRPGIERRMRGWARGWIEEKPLNLCEPSSWGADYCGVKPSDTDYIVTKHRSSAFFGTDLDLVLRSRGIKTVLLTGVATNACVESSARHACMLDYKVILVDDCCAARTKVQHQASLVNIKEHFGTVVTAADVVAAWNPS